MSVAFQEVAYGQPNEYRRYPSEVWRDSELDYPGVSRPHVRLGDGVILLVRGGPTGPSQPSLRALFRYEPLDSCQAKAWAADTERARRYFVERAGRLSGVLRIESCHGTAIGEPLLRLHVAEDDLDTRYKIYDLEAQTFDLYPKAELDVMVVDDVPEKREASEGMEPAV